MLFTWVDGIALALLVVMFIRGWSAGFIVMAGNLLSLVLGVGITAYLFAWVSSWWQITNWHLAHPILAVVLFLVALGIVVRLLRLLVKVLNAMFKIVSIIPFVGTLNRLLGAALGTLVAGVLVLVGVWVVENFGYQAMPNAWEAAFTTSYTFNYLSYVTDVLLPMMPFSI